MVSPSQMLLLKVDLKIKSEGSSPSLTSLATPLWSITYLPSQDKATQKNPFLTLDQ